MTPSKLALLACALVPLAGCATPRIVATAKPFCPAMQHVCIGKDDELTEPTAQQIEGNNLARVKLCGKPPVCKLDRQAQINAANTLKLPKLGILR